MLRAHHIKNRDVSTHCYFFSWHGTLCVLTRMGSCLLLEQEHKKCFRYYRKHVCPRRKTLKGKLHLDLCYERKHMCQMELAVRNHATMMPGCCDRCHEAGYLFTGPRALTCPYISFDPYIWLMSLKVRLRKLFVHFMI